MKSFFYLRWHNFYRCWRFNVCKFVEKLWWFQTEVCDAMKAITPPLTETNSMNERIWLRNLSASIDVYWYLFSLYQFVYTGRHRKHFNFNRIFSAHRRFMYYVRNFYHNILFSRIRTIAKLIRLSINGMRQFSRVLFAFSVQTIV